MGKEVRVEVTVSIVHLKLTEQDSCFSILQFAL